MRSAVGVVGLLVLSAGVHASVPYSSCFERSATRHDVTASLLQGVAAVESDFNPNARSHANAHGLMQIQWPGTAKHLGVRRLAQLYDPCKNIELGARYLRELLDRYEQDEQRALAAYNYGPGRIKTSGALPRGAQAYAARVAKQHQRFARLAQRSPLREGSQRSSLEVKKGDKMIKNQKVADFSSRLRAKRFAGLLRRRVPAGQFEIHRAALGRYAIMLVGSKRPLNADEQLTLQSLGWRGAS